MTEIENIDRVPLVVTYHPERPCLGKIFRNHLPTLYISEKVKKVVPNPPLVANGRPKNLKDLLVRATMKPPQQLHEGNSPCGRLRCKSSVHIWTSMTFAAAITGEKFRARVTANCRTKNIVYLIERQRCKETVCWGNGEPLTFTYEWP